MNYVNMLLSLLQFLPGIANNIHQLHASKTAAEKIAIGANLLGTSVAVSQALLPPDQAKMAGVAGAAAQTILATTIQAIHDASNPTPAPAPSLA